MDSDRKKLLQEDHAGLFRKAKKALTPLNGINVFI